MDANNIEFEDIISNIDSQLKIKDLYRFIALKNNYQNSEHLKQDEKNAVLQEIIEHFNVKHNNSVSFKFNITPEKFQQTLTLEHKFLPREESHARYLSNLNTIKNKLDKIEVCFKYIPILDGGIVTNFESADAILLDKELNLFGKFSNSYWDNLSLGSFLSKNNHWLCLNKKSLPEILKSNLENISQMKIEYQEKIISINSEKELQKFLKTIRV